MRGERALGSPAAPHARSSPSKGNVNGIVRGPQLCGRLDMNFVPDLMETFPLPRCRRNGKVVCFNLGLGLIVLPTEKEKKKNPYVCRLLLIYLAFA